MVASTNLMMMTSLDSIDPNKLGERLRIARCNVGLTQEIAAKMIGMSRPTLVAIEQGQRKIRGDELCRLADVLKVSINELIRDTAVHIDLAAKFRRAGTKLKKSEEDAIALLKRVAAASVELEARLGRKPSIRFPQERPIQPGSLEEQAEDLALDLRHRLGLGLSPVADIVSLVEIELGIRIFFRKLHSSISGLFAFDPEIGGCILVNSVHTEERQILTILHEVGHFLCTRLEPDVVSENDSAAREEKFVTLFAIAFLMPAVAIRRRFQEVIVATGKFSPRYLFLTANYFRVSVESLTRRLESLKLLPHGTFDSLRDRGLSIESTKAALGLSSALLLSTPSRLMLMASEAYEKQLFSEGQLSDLLSLDRVELRKHLAAFESEQIDDGIALAT